MLRIRGRSKRVDTIFAWRPSVGRIDVLLAVAALATFPAGAQLGDVPTIRTPEAFAETPPLSSVQPVVPPGPIILKVQPENTLPPWLNFGGPTAAAGSPSASAVLQQEMGLLAMPSLIRSWDGNGFGLPGFTMTGVPPDTEGDVGPNHYVQWVNTMFTIWNKTGTKLYGPANGNTLFGALGGRCASDNDGDPLVMYDPISDRWFMSQFAVSASPYYQCVAVSKTSDPTGAWYTWAFNYGTSFDDYGKSGVWPDGYYIMYHMFTTSGLWLGTEVCVFDRVSMLAGVAGATQQCFGPNLNYGGLLPSHLNLAGTFPPPGGAPNYYLAYGASGQLLLWPFHVDWTTPANSTFGTGGTFVPKSITVAAFKEPCNGLPSECVPQAGTTTKVDTLGDRLMWRLNYRNFGSHESLVVTHSVDTGTNAQTGIRWYEIRSPGAVAPTVFQQGTYSPDTAHRFMGSVNMDKAGNMAVGYSVSSSSMNPAIRYAGRLAGDTAGQLSQGESTLLAGTGSQTTFNTSSCPSTGGANAACPLTRWGDYSTMSVDPSDGCTFWFTTEYLVANGAFNWQTRIASFKYPSCSSGCPVITGTVSGGGTVCSGSSSTVTVTVSGGTPPYSVTLTNGGGALAGAGPSFNFSVSPSSTTTYAVQTLTDSVGCSGAGSGSATVTVNAIPATPTAGNGGAVCTGGTISLTASTVAGATYSWTGPSGFASAQQNPTIPNATTAMSGTYSVTATVGACTSPAGTTSVTVDGAPVLHPIPSPVVVGSSNTLSGCGFTAGSRIMMFVATASGASAHGPYTPTSWSNANLVWLVNPSIGLGNGFATFLVVNTDQGYIQSNTQSALLYGTASQNIPTITALNGVPLRPMDPTIPTANVETVITQGTTVTLTGTGFSNTLVNLFTAAGNKGPLTPLPGATSAQIQVVVPADTPTGPGSFQGVNSPYTGNVLSNAVSVPIGALVTISNISLTGDVVTVTGTGFCTLTVINLFAQTASGVQNLGGLNGSGTSLIPLTIDSSTQFHFTRPVAALVGAAYVMAINPPFIAYSSSGVGPTGGFLFP
jgi:hypothetical protein